MPNKKAFLLLNGNVPNELPSFHSYDLIVAVDGAFQTAVNKKIPINLITGDFDSIQELKNTSTFIERIHTPDQNFTDFHKCLKELVKKGVKTVDVYGANGLEQDHYLGNLSTAYQWSNELNLVFHDDYGVSFFLEKDNQYKFNDCLNKTISLVPFLDAGGITTKGLKYPLKQESLNFFKRIGTRNVATSEEIQIHYTQGILFLFIQNKT